MVFIIPGKLEDLEKFPEDERFHVKTTGKSWSDDQFNDFVEELAPDLSRNREDILESKIFEPIYWSIKQHLSNTKESFPTTIVKII